MIEIGLLGYEIVFEENVVGEFGVEGELGECVFVVDVVVVVFGVFGLEEVVDV